MMNKKNPYIPFKALFDYSLDAYLLIDADNETILDLNPAAEDLLGYSKNELRNKPFTLLFPPDEYQTRKEILELVQTRGRALARQPFLTKKGPVRYMDVSATLVHTDSGHPIIICNLRDATEYEQALRLIEEKHRFIERLSEHLPVLFYRRKKEEPGDFIVLEGNKRQIFGEDYTEALTDRPSLQKLIIPADYERALKEIESALSSRGTFTVHYRIRRPDMTSLWVMDHGYLAPTGENDMLIEGFFLDIHQRKILDNIYQKLTEYMIRLQGTPLIENILHSLLKEMNLDGAFLTRWDPSQPDDVRIVVGATHNGVTLPESYQLQGTPCNTVLETGKIVILAKGAGKYFEKSRPLESLHIEFYAGFPYHLSQSAEKGHLVILSHRPQNLEPELIRFLYTLANLMGVEYQKERLEQTLKEEKEYIDSILSSLREALFSLDENYHVQWKNPLATQYLREYGQFENERLYSIFFVPIDEVLKKASKAPWFVQHPESNQYFEVICHSARITGTHTGWVLTIRDITEQRTQEVQMDLLRRLSSLGQLTSGITHEFNNDLNVIMGAAQLITMEKSADKKIKQLAEQIIAQGKRASELIRQIVDFSDQQLKEPEPIDLLSFLKDFVAFIRQILPETINVKFSYKPGTYGMVANRAQLMQAILNIVINARDAMPDGGDLDILLFPYKTTSSTSTPSELESGSWAIIEIKDTGVGIAREHLPHLFEPFFTTKEPGTSRGLGLAQTYGIIRQHRGYIQVESEVGKGTRFRIYLPVEPHNQ